MKTKIINEAYWHRALACIAVVITHAVNTTLTNYEFTISQFNEYALILIRFIAFFGTPTFIFISELLLAHAYPNGVPKGFFMKRIKFLLFPFLTLAIVFASVESRTQNEFFHQAFFNIFLGGYTGYFILIIFQFYILHVMLHKQLSKWSPKLVLCVTFMMNVAYLAYFNFTAPINIPLGEYIWQRGYWLPFLGWVFYFALGYYCGKNYQTLKEKVTEYKKLIISMTLMSLLLMIFFVRSDTLTVVSSKRADMIFYTTGVIFLVIMLTSQLKHVPKPVLFMSKYSFNIYLLHKIFLYYLEPINGLHPLIYFLFAIAFSIFGAVLVSIMLRAFSFSPYFIGKTLPVPSHLKRNNHQYGREIPNKIDVINKDSL
ncbi:acyltransferase family protein [Bacillus shivajii]|uniref:acyltransferase family protein n=1 Tax=Bacillus shivajii TaxID=1983719 RepID=UPI001CF9BC3D|nr:acyltransferase family protein [Bacillus shivajii]UCZ53540.1 acyltransferase family protein [Bacillus shivajii]